MYFLIKYGLSELRHNYKRMKSLIQRKIIIVIFRYNRYYFALNELQGRF